MAPDTVFFCFVFKERILNASQFLFTLVVKAVHVIKIDQDPLLKQTGSSVKSRETVKLQQTDFHAAGH